MAGTISRLMMGCLNAMYHASRGCELSRLKMWSAFQLSSGDSSINPSPAYHFFARFKHVGSDQFQNCGSSSLA